MVALGTTPATCPHLAHCRDSGRPSWRPVIEVLRANRPPVVEVVISSIIRQSNDWVRWRPVFEQVLPWRSLNSAAGFDPQLTLRTAACCDASFPCDKAPERILSRYLRFDQLNDRQR